MFVLIVYVQKSENYKEDVHIKQVNSNIREKELRASAIRGVVKLLNMIARYKQNVANKDQTGVRHGGSPRTLRPKKRVQISSIGQINRFNEVIRSASKLVNQPFLECSK